MEKEICEYDFKNPPRLTKDNILFIKMLNEDFSKRLSLWFSNRLQEEIIIKEKDSQQIHYTDFITKHSYPTILCILSQSPLSSFSIIWIKPSLVFYLIDRSLGGKGGEVIINREITSVEKEVLKRFVMEFTKILSDVWLSVLKIDFKLEDIITNPSNFKGIEDNELVIMTNFKIKIKEREEDFSLCLPFISVEPYLDKLTTKPKEEKKISEASSKAIESIFLPIVALLGKTTLTIDDILKLSSGDVLKLSTKVSDGIILSAGEKPRFAGNPGISGGNIAVQIKRVIMEEQGSI